MSLLDTIDCFDAYCARDGGNGLAAARVLGSEATLRELAHAGLRGRGGAGSATGHTWRAARDATTVPRRVVANGTDVEPASFKHRALLRANPYQLLEGLAIAALTVGSDRAFVAIPASYAVEIDRVRRAIDEMSRAGALADLAFTVVPGPEEYVFGHESALLAVIDGKDPFPRIVPRADVVDDVETLAHVATILARGSAWFRSRGTSRSPGTMVFTICGDVQRPGVHEIGLGTPLRTLVEERGCGTASGRNVKVVCGGSRAVVPGTRLDIALDDDAFARVGATLGSGGFAVYGDDVCALALARAYSNFLWVESCGQCPACKLGSGAITTALALLERRGDAEQFAVLQRSLATIGDGSRCALPVEQRNIVGGLLRAFPQDVVAHEERRCALRHDMIVPAIVRLDDGDAEYDLRLPGKRPDWSYAPKLAPALTAVQASARGVS